MRRFAVVAVLIGAIGVPTASALINDKKQPAPAEPLVCVLPKGDIYHNRDCVTLRKSKNFLEITLTEAALTGLRPCLRCTPPKKEIVLDKPIPITAEKLLAEPNQFDGKRVQLKGTVVELTQTGGVARNGKTTLVLADAGRKVTVHSNYGVAVQLKDAILVTGKFSKETSKIDATPIIGKIEVHRD